MGNTNKDGKSMGGRERMRGKEGMKGNVEDGRWTKEEKDKRYRGRK